MKKPIALIAAIFLLCSAAFCLFSCKKKKVDLKDEVYTVSFSTAYLSSSAFAPDPVKVKRGETIGKPDVTYDAKAGFEVVWSPDGLNPYAYDFSSPVTESFTLYAVEVPKKYAIKYLLQMGRNAAENPSSYDKTTEFMLAKAIAPFGWKFVKWSYFDDPESNVTRIEKGTEGTLVLRAVFEPVRYEVLYIGLEGAENPNPEVYVFGEELPLQDLSRSDARFLGFSVGGAADGEYVRALTPSFVEEHQKELFKVNGSSIALFANWEERE